MTLQTLFGSIVAAEILHYDEMVPIEMVPIEIVRTGCSNHWRPIEMVRTGCSNHWFPNELVTTGCSNHWSPSEMVRTECSNRGFPIELVRTGCSNHHRSEPNIGVLDQIKILEPIPVWSMKSLWPTPDHK